MNSRLWVSGVIAIVGAASMSPKASASVPFRVQGTLIQADQPDPPIFPSLSPASVGMPATGVFNYLPEFAEPGGLVYGAPAVMVGEATFDIDTLSAGRILNTTGAEIQNDVTGDFVGIGDRVYARFDTLPAVGLSGFGTFGFSIEFIDLDATVFDSPRPITDLNDILVNLDLREYEIARWTMELSDAGDTGFADLRASGDIVPIPEPSAGTLATLVGILYLAGGRRRPRKGRMNR